MKLFRRGPTQGGEIASELKITRTKDFSLESQSHTSRYQRKIHRIEGLTSKEGISKIHPSIPQKYPFGRICAVLVVLLMLTPIFLTHSNEEISGEDNSQVESGGGIEYPDLVAVSEDTITFSAKETLNTRKNHNITGTRGYSGTSPPVGDWVISGVAVVWNETITLNGNLTVTPTGNLTLINVTLKINCGYNGEYHIEVQGGGGLSINDFDWDRLTEDDASEITAVNTSYKYLFRVQKDSFFEMRNSKLSWCGYKWGNNGDHSGLWINTNSTIIDGNLITDLWTGLVFYESFYNIIINNTIKENIYPGVKTETYDALCAGIILLSTSLSIINNNLIQNYTGRDVRDNWGSGLPGGLAAGIYLQNSNNNIILNNNITNNTGGKGGSDIGPGVTTGGDGGIAAGIYLKFSYGNNLIENIIYNQKGGIGGQDDQGGNGGTGSGINLYSSSRIYIYNCKVYESMGGLAGPHSGWPGSNGLGNGIFLESSLNENNILNNYFAKNSYSGIYLKASSKNKIINNTIFENKIIGIRLASSSNENNVSQNLINNNVNFGLVLETGSNNNIVNNYLFNHSKDGVYLKSSLYNQLIANMINNNGLDGIYLSLSLYNSIYHNSIYENSQQGIYLQQSSYNSIYNNSIIDNSDHGISLYSSSYNSIINCSISSNKNSGISLSGSSNRNNIINSTIYNNSKQGLFLQSSTHNNYVSKCNIYDNLQYGIGMASSSNNNITGCNISYNTLGGIYCHTTSNNNLIINSTVENPTSYDYLFNSDSHLISLNSEFNKTNVKFNDGKSTLTVKWYLNVKVVNFADKPIVNSTVNVRENTNGTYNKNFTTGLDGYVKSIHTTEYVQDSSMITYLTPHNITATFKGYTVNVMPKPFINRTTTIVIRLRVPGNYTILYPGWNLISFPYIQLNASVKTVLQQLDGQYNAVQWFNSSDVNDHWKHYNTLKFSNLNDLKELNHKMGFWIHITSPEGASLLFVGDIPTVDQTIELSKGWNLVGYPSIMGRFRDDALNNLNYGSDIRLIQYFDAKFQSWKSLAANEKIKKGIGYWFYANSDMIWIVNNSVFPVYNINKDEYYITIQEGINDADNSDIIEINEGTFYENVIVNKSVILLGTNKIKTVITGGFNITNNNANLSYMTISNSSSAINVFNASDVYISDIIIDNCTDAIKIENSSHIDFEYINITDCLYGISSYNSSPVSIITSSIYQSAVFNIIQVNSNVTILNSIFNKSKIQFYDPNSRLIVQWFFNVLLKDQLNSPINDAIVEVYDNQNGTFYGIYSTELDGFVRSIVVTERIQNSIGNVSFSPYNITATHPDFSFYDVPREVNINKTTTVVIISINTLSQTSIFNVDRNRYYLTIHEAGDDANPYDTIQISPGTYYENIEVYKPLNLVGEDKYTTFINGNGEVGVNITFDDVTISGLNIQNGTYGIYLDSSSGVDISDLIVSNNTNGIHLESSNGIDISDLIVSNNTYGFYYNNSSTIIDGCIIENNNIGIMGYNNSNLDIFNCSLQNDILEFIISNSHFTTLNTHFNITKVAFLDSISNLTVNWYLHVRVQDAYGARIIGANVWIVDNENGTYDKNFTTGADGYVWFIILTERIQNLTGNISFNPYTINVSYFDADYGYGWLTFPDSPRNISINGSLFEIRKEVFTSLEAIPEFPLILAPMMAVVATFVLFRKKRK